MNIIIGTGNNEPSNYYAYYEYGSVSPTWKVYVLKTNDYYDIYFDNMGYMDNSYLEVSYTPGCNFTLGSANNITIPSGATLLEGRRSGSQGFQGIQGPQGIKGQDGRNGSDATVTWDKIKSLFNANGFTLTNGQLRATCFQATSGFYEG